MTLDLLLFNFLGELIYYKDSEQLLLQAQQVQISRKMDYSSCSCSGEMLDSHRHQQRVDVKAVTLHRSNWKKQMTVGRPW